MIALAVIIGCLATFCCIRSIALDRAAWRDHRLDDDNGLKDWSFRKTLTASAIAGNTPEKFFDAQGLKLHQRGQMWGIGFVGLLMLLMAVVCAIGIL